MGVDEIRTARLLLRRWQHADREPWAALNADPEVRRFFMTTLTRDESDRAVDRYESAFQSEGIGLWALQRLDSDEFIGFTGLHPMPAGGPGAGHWEVGWRLSRAAWHHGFATEAAAAALAVAFGQLRADEVWSHTATQNAASIAVMRRLGMRFVVEAAHPDLPVDHALSPHVYYQLRAADRPDFGD